MTIVDFEIEEIQKLCENVVPGSKIIICSSNLVRINLETEYNRQLSVCLRFPENYPRNHILIEIKSRTLSEKFILRLANLAEAKAKEILDKPQVICVLKFIEQYLRDNPLCVAYDEILELKKDLGKEATEKLKLKQKTRSVQLITKGGNYYYKIKAEIPEEYPKKCIVLKDAETNLPPVLLRYLNGQSKEIARKCVEPPARLVKDKNSASFQPTPSLYKSLKFCIDATKDFCEELCPICNVTVLPKDPDMVVLDDSNEMMVERVYCGHIYHQGCLKRYLNEPPFPKDGKLCPALKQHARSDAMNYLGVCSTSSNVNGKCVGTAKKTTSRKSNFNNSETCGIKLAHDRWVTSAEVAEARWAQKQAREREIQEVIDFMT